MLSHAPTATHSNRGGLGVTLPGWNWKRPGPRFPRTRAPVSERVTGIEPALSAWEPYKIL
jgi:hypothetical protein